MKPVTKAYIVTTIFFASVLGCGFLLLGTSTAAHRHSLMKHIFDADILLTGVIPIVILYFLTVVLLTASMNRQLRKEQEEQDRLEQEATQEKMNKVLDLQLAELQRKQKELDERERKLNEAEETSNN